MPFHPFYFTRLPRFTDILKKNIAKELKNDSNQSVQHLIHSFLNFFEHNNAFDFFKEYEINRDEINLSLILTGLEDRLYPIGNYNVLRAERKIKINGIDEEFQIQLECSICMPYADESVYESFDLERTAENLFFHWKTGKADFQDFTNVIYSSAGIASVLSYPVDTVGIHITYDL